MEVTLRRWKRTEYERLVDLGVFAGEPIELIGGQLMVAEPQGSCHVAGVVKTDYSDFDRIRKGSLYARGGIADYWIVNLIDRVLEIHREPVRDTAAPYGWRYRSVQTLPPTASATPLAIPSARVAVADLLP